MLHSKIVVLIWGVTKFPGGHKPLSAPQDGKFVH